MQRVRAFLYHEQKTLYGDLNPSAEKIELKSVALVKSRVINIEEVSPGMTTDQIKRSMVENFVAHYSPIGSCNFESTQDAIIELFE